LEGRTLAKLRVKLIKSIIGSKENQISTVKALGLKKLNSEVEHNDTPQIRGMIQKVIHLVEVKEM
jgi:large subunit ribosomal protein L30